MLLMDKPSNSWSMLQYLLSKWIVLAQNVKSLHLKSGMYFSGYSNNSAVCRAKGILVCPFINKIDFAEGLIVL
jgi:hypothetical protein